MRNGRHTVLIGLALLFLVTPVAAQTTGFDDLPGIEASIPNGYFGLQWNNFWYLDTPASSPSPNGYQAGTVSGTNVAFSWDPTIPAYFSAASPFTFNSAYLTAAWNDGLNLNVTGYLGGTQVFTQALTLSATSPTFAVFNWSNIDKVSFVSSGGAAYYNGNSGENFVMDNLTLNQPFSGGGMTPTPEPPSVLLLATGLLGLAFVVARRHHRGLSGLDGVA